jgi:ribA/ribD-fused uncharacterized protein
MNICSFFIENKALFGSFPSQKDVEELESRGVKYIINLTNINEKKIKPYLTKTNYLHFPMEDHKSPSNWILFAKFLIDVCEVIKNLREDEKIFIHCKAGLGRSGLVVASILCFLKNMNPEESLEATTKFYRQRLILNEKLKNCPCPNTYTQRSFIFKFFKPLYFYKAFKTGNTVGFSNFSLHSVELPDLGLFYTAEAAFQSTKNVDDKSYVGKLQKTTNPSIAKRLGKLCLITEEWLEEREEIMKSILLLKLSQNAEIKKNLLSTGLRPIINSDKNDSYWGLGVDNSGDNILGKILTEIRLQYLKEEE